MSESETAPTRELAAIMFSDIAGYSTIMGRDERTALRALTEHRDLLRSLLAKYNGRMLGEIGDGTLTSFHSALDAVNCAREMQTALKDDPELRVRIGIHIGDVLFSADNVWGDGVNVASRIHALAAPGGICMSAHVYDEIRNKPGMRAKYLGQKNLKNISRLIGVYALAGFGPEVDSTSALAGRDWRSFNRSRAAAVTLAIAALILLGGFGIHRFYWQRILAAKEIYLPRILPKAVDQKMGFCTASDGVHIAYASSGTGPPLVIMIGWVTHLERGFLSPAYFGDALRGFGAHHLVVRYDTRGFGLSDRGMSDYSLDARVRDLEAVTDALKLKRFSIYAISFGGPTVIAYAARHPERINRLIFYGTYARFIHDPQERQKWEAMITLMRTGWGSDNPTYRQLFTSLFMPDGSEADQRVLTEMGRVAATPEDAAGFMTATLNIDVRDLARQIRAPTLVVHTRGDQVVPLESGRELAGLIPGARMAVIEGRDHVLVPGDGEQEQLVPAVASFLDEDLDAQKVKATMVPSSP
ncbi:MAG TPA: alpha/beta fold hydrolase [Candidatus Binataceae bacterium]|nr:alpha/beta fold hydrolase [Candidatus Binataceae bacterium]